jgi:type VI secretion system protein ImpL
MPIFQDSTHGTASAIKARVLDCARWLAARCTFNAWTMGLVMLLLASQVFRPSLGRWPLAAAAALLSIALAFSACRRIRARRRAAKDDATPKDAGGGRAGQERLRAGLLEALHIIKTSRLARVTGKDALYELPWYMVIGRPGAGKSQAILNSGLQFPFTEKQGGTISDLEATRDCGWFFTSEGILLDTAGRYSVQEHARGDWLGFLRLLKRHRYKAPVNGVIVMASIGELATNPHDFAINLAKSLRQRVQEVTDRLEIQVPVYVVFTKADQIGGFSEFFEDMTEQERRRVWGATLPYQPEESAELLPQFDRSFDELHAGLKEMARTRMAIRRSGGIPASLLSFPQEFHGLKPALRNFLSTLFDVNPYQHKPVFRGFYFSSARQEAPASSPHAARIASQFGLSPGTEENLRSPASRGGFFLRDLFVDVIFADRGLVRQQSSPTRTRVRYAAFFAMVVIFGLALGGWTWSYLGNRQLTDHVRADLEQIVSMGRSQGDLQSSAPSKFSRTASRSWTAMTTRPGCRPDWVCIRGIACAGGCYRSTTMA